MGSRTATNILLLLILLCLMVMAIPRLPVKNAIAETFKLDSCITTSPYDKPEAYVHVISHDVSPIQSGGSLR